MNQTTVKSVCKPEVKKRQIDGEWNSIWSCTAITVPAVFPNRSAIKYLYFLFYSIEDGGWLAHVAFDTDSVISLKSKTSWTKL